MRGCLASLTCQTRFPDEVVVVDNAAPGERTVESIVRRMPAVRYVREDVPGIANARNRGIATAGGAIVAFLDDDCRPDPNWLQSLCDAFVEAPQLGGVTGPVLPVRLTTREQHLLEERGGFSRGEQPVTFYPDDDYLVQAWRLGTGGNMAFRREALEAVGGFDRVLRVGEDLDILFRIVHRGWPLRYEPAVRIYHLHVPRYNELRTRLFRWGWAYAGFLTKTALSVPEQRRRALREYVGTLRYHLWERLWPATRHGGPFPRRLIITEIVGLLTGAPGYLFGRWRRGG